MKITAYFDDYNLIKAYVYKPFDALSFKEAVIENTKGPLTFKIGKCEDKGNYYKYILELSEDYDCDDYRLIFRNEKHDIYLRHIVSKKRFEEENKIDVNILGSFYYHDHTTFRLFSPAAKSVSVYVLKDKLSYPMKKIAYGLFELSLAGDLEGMAYLYEIEINGELKRCPDPFAYSSGLNNAFSYVIDLKKIDNTVYKPQTVLKDHSDAIIYELSVRDFTSMPIANTLTHGKFVSLMEEGTSYNGQPTSLDYLKSIGITHVQLMPVFDFGSVDEKDNIAYNWGYDPVAYNTLEGSYIKNVSDPYAKIYEFKEMVNTFHKNDIRVNLDLVFNHVYKADEFMLNIIYPYAIYRYTSDEELSNGSYCGNEVRSEGQFMHDYLLLMIKRYLHLFDIDGIRFDLMGLMDIDTIKDVIELVKEFKSDFMIYGEGWSMPTVLKRDKAATMQNYAKIKDVAFFNPYFRDSIKGSTLDKDDKGYLLNDLGRSNDVKKALSAYKDSHLFASPLQSINYLECHDNMTFYDKMHYCLKGESYQNEMQRAKLGLAMILLAQGIPFIHSGQEFMRTKYGKDNTYNLGDYYNQFDYNLRNQNLEMVEFFKDLIKIRKAYPEFHLTTYEDIKEKVSFEDYYEVLIYRIKDLTVFFNPCIFEHIYPLDKEYRIVYLGDHFDDVLVSKAIRLSPLSLTIIKGT